MIRRLQRWLFFATLPILTVADMFSPVLFIGEYNSGYLKLALLSLLLAVSAPFLRPDRITLAIVLFLYYLGNVAFFASDYGNSFVGWHRIVIAFGMYPVAYYTLRGLDDMVRFQKMVLLSAGIVVGAAILAQFLQMGVQAYRTDIYLGGMGAYAALYLGYGVLGASLSVVLLRGSLAGKASIPIFAMAVVVVLFSFRRSAMVGTVAGAAVLILLSRGTLLSPVRAIRWGTLAAMSAAVVLSVYGSQIQDLASRRGLTSIEGEMESRYGRVNETRYVIDAFLNDGIRHALFGTEFFNARELLGWGAKNRTIHVDYNVLLHGAGAVGLLLYLVVFLLIAARLYRSRRALSGNRLGALLTACGAAILVANFIFSAGNQLWVTLPYALMFMYLGAIQRTADLLAAAAPAPGAPPRAPHPARVPRFPVKPAARRGLPSSR